MKLSIITINYNNVNGLRKTIQSVFSQSICDFEYIIIDGGSTDGSIEVIDEYSEKISYWISESDKGIYHAMNKGILIAKGEYCQFLNSGDTLASIHVTENILSSLSDCNILIGNMLKIFPDGRTYLDKGQSGSPISFLTFYSSTLNHSSAYIKRNLFDKYGLYDESLKIVSDWKWYLIVVGFSKEKVTYRDMDITCFDMSGISNKEIILEKSERRMVLKELIPDNILADYDMYFKNIDQMKRIKKYSLSFWIFWLIERIIFKLEKWEDAKNWTKKL